MSKKLIGVLSVALVIAGIGTLAYFTDGFRNWDFNSSSELPPEDNTDLKGSVETETTDSGIKLKLLSSNVLDNGSVEKIFSYSINPDNATVQEITAEAKYSDDTSCDDVLKVNVLNGTKQIVLTCTGAFDKVINVTLTSIDNSEATATITVNYIKRIEGVEIRLNRSIDVIDQVKAFTLNDFYDGVYSKYTKDKTYTLSWYQDPYVELQSGVNDNIGGVIDDGLSKFESLIIERITNFGAFPTAEEIWNLSETQEWKEFLLQHSPSYDGEVDPPYVVNPDVDYYKFHIDGRLLINEDPNLYFDLDTEFFIATILYDYNEFKVPVEEVVPEVPNVDI